MPFDANAYVGQLGGWDPNPANWGPLYAAAAKQYGVPETLLRALTQVESNGKADAVSKAGAEGSQQIMPDTRDQLGIKNSFDPREAIPASAKLLKQAYDSTGSWSTALKTYAGGPDTSKWGPETNAYPGKIAQAYTGLGGDATNDLGIWNAKAQPGPGPQGQSFGGTVAHVAPVPGSTPAPQGQVTGASESDLGPEAASQGGFDPGAVIKQLQGLFPQPQATAPQGASAGSPAGSPAVPSLAGPQAQPLAPVAPVGQTQFPVASGPTWGPVQQYASGALLGAGPQFAGSIQAAKTLFPGNSNGLSPAETYAQATAAYQAAQQRWEAANPKSSFLQLTGSIPTTMLGTAGLGAAAGMGARAVGSVLPQVGNALGDVINFAAGNGGSGTLSSLASSVLGGGAQGAGTAALQSGMSSDPLSRQVEEGAGIGALLNPIIRGAMSFANPVIRPALAQLVDRYHQLIGPEATASAGLRPGQITTNPVLKYLDRKNVVGNEQLPEFTRALSRTVGADTDQILREDFSQIRGAIGQRLNAVAQRTGMNYDRALDTRLQALRQKALADLSPDLPPEREALISVNRAIDDVENRALQHNLQVPGREYQELTTKDSFIGRMVDSPNTEVRRLGVELRSALDDALSRSSSPADVAALREYRQQWKNSVVLEDLVGKGNGAGVLNPQQLQNRVHAIYSSYRWATPQDIHTLADIGKLLPSADATGGARASASHGRLLSTVERFLMAGGIGAHEFGREEGLPIAALGGAIYAAHHGMRAALESNAFRQHALDVALGRKAALGTGPNVLVPLVSGLLNENSGPPRTGAPLPAALLGGM